MYVDTNNKQIHIKIYVTIGASGRILFEYSFAMEYERIIFFLSKECLFCVDYNF